VQDADWTQLKAELRTQTEAWSGALKDERELDDVALTGLIGSVVHLAYHLGAIRQMASVLAGPPARD
jgi:hypothetical protein